MNDDAAHREEHTGEHLQNAVLNGTDRRFSLRSPQARFCPLSHTRTYKPPLRFSILELGPSGPLHDGKSPGPGGDGAHWSVVRSGHGG